MSNSINSGNIGGDCGRNIGVINSSGYNIDSDGTCGLNATGDLANTPMADIMLGPLTNNGRTTQTHALLPGSLAIDAGSCVTGADQRGMPRPQGVACDIGAYEAEPAVRVSATVKVTGNGSVTGGNTINCPKVSCSESFNQGDSLTLAANPGKNMVTTWGGDCQGARGNVCALTMDGDKRVSVRFAATSTPPPPPPVPPASPPPADPESGAQNNPPQPPGEGSWLVFPNDGDMLKGSAAFIWKKLTDPDGNEIEYSLYICPNGEFDSCNPIRRTKGGNAQRYGYGLGAFGAAGLLMGLGFTRGARRRIVMVIVAISLAGSVTLVACGDSKVADTSRYTCSGAGEDEVCAEQMALTIGHYQWKVIADDGAGGVVESEIRKFTAN